MTEDLIDIFDDIVAEETPSIFTSETIDETVTTILHLMEDYINENPREITEPDFDDELIENINELVELQFENLEEDDKDILDDIIHEARAIFYQSFIPERSFSQTFITGKPDKNAITNQLEYLRGKPQPAQRTKEWYEFRHKLITASNAYKAFEGESTKNQLIYEKCQPLDVGEKLHQMVNISTTLHWGQKYEPISVMLYEYMFGTKVGDFGCIQHDKYSFLGASPDGINIDANSPTYGRMLEIKNIVNREIDGIPKKEYWIQMQLQMEVCNLDECDFLETKFVEYVETDEFSSFVNFSQDGTFSKSKNDEMKGVILYFAKSDGNPHYVYMPFSIQTMEQFEDWSEQLHHSNMTWIKNIYWKLEKYSCVLVLRNKKWFADNIDALHDVWNIILHERVNGFHHRGPAKRTKKELIQDNASESTCFLNINKETGKTIIMQNPIIEKISVVKIRTESFDETKTNMLISH